MHSEETSKVEIRGLSLMRPVLLLLSAAVLLAALTALALTHEWALIMVVAAGVAVATMYLLAGDYAASRRSHTERRLARAIAGDVARLSRRAPTIDNIAGSVGRAAPLIREIHKSSQRTETVPNAGSAVAKPVGGTSVVRGPGPDKTVSPSFQPAKSSRAPKTYPGCRVLMVADDFTIESFSDEWTVVTPTPEDWEAQLENGPYDLLFVESAWQGNSGSWLYHLVGASAPRPAIVALVDACREREVPTIFWNKEDPPHFDDFLDTARLFDWVATTDGDLLDAYREALGHDRVFCLPFAAQHRLHNPIRPSTTLKRDRPVVFGGMYFATKYPERRAQMDVLLPAAAKVGLDIYTRHASSPEYAFPSEYESSVRGSLPYREMVTAYKAYKVVINVNSVVDSQTMCARRVFEATGSGAAVVTTETPALKNFFGDDHLTFAEDGRSAYDAMRVLVNSDETRDRLVHRAQREIWRHHTYSHRAAEVMTAVGLEPEREWQHMPVSVICPTTRPGQLRSILNNHARQSHSDRELIVAMHGFKWSDETVRAEAERAGLAGPPTLLHLDPSRSLGEVLQALVVSSSGRFITRMDDDDFYGENYVEDLLHAYRYSGADLVGKEASYLYFESLGATYLTFPHREHSWTNFVRGATFAGPVETFKGIGFEAQGVGEDSSFLSNLVREGGRVYSADRFNFVAHRGADKTSHTWRAQDMHLAASGRMVCVGNGSDQVSL